MNAFCINATHTPSKAIEIASLQNDRECARTKLIEYPHFLWLSLLLLLLLLFFFWMNTSSAHVYITHTYSGYILSAPQRLAVRFSFFPRSFCVFPLNGVVAIFVVIVLVAAVAIAADSFVYRWLRLNFPHYIRLPFTITTFVGLVCLSYFPFSNGNCL